MAQISEKSWELPNFWALVQNPASRGMVGPLGGLEKKIVNPFVTCKPKMDQKGPVLGPFLARFSICGRHLEALGVRPYLENGWLWSEISESPNPPFFRKILAQTKFLDRGGGQASPPNCEIVSYGTHSEIGGCPVPPLSNIFVWAENFHYIFLKKEQFLHPQIS